MLYDVFLSAYNLYVYVFLSISFLCVRYTSFVFFMLNRHILSQELYFFSLSRFNVFYVFLTFCIAYLTFAFCVFFEKFWKNNLSNNNNNNNNGYF